LSVFIDNLIAMNKLCIVLFSILFFSSRIFAQCDTLTLNANYQTYKDTISEYYGDFQVLGSQNDALFSIKGKESSIKLPYKFQADSLGSSSPKTKLTVLFQNKSRCIYTLDLPAKEYKTEIGGTGTSSNVSLVYIFENRVATLLGEYIPPPPIDTVVIVPPKQDTIIYKDINFYFPNAISPNDDKINDDFQVFASENVLIDVIEIFDRWGNSRFLDQGDLYVGYLIFKNNIKKRFSFSVVEK
jgi:CHU_C Type IX secretion signal domain